MIRTVQIGEGVVPITWNNFLFSMWTLGTLVLTENTEEVPSEITVQNYSVQPVVHRMYHLANKAT